MKRLLIVIISGLVLGCTFLATNTSASAAADPNLRKETSRLWGCTGTYQVKKNWVGVYTARVDFNSGGQYCNVNIRWNKKLPNGSIQLSPTNTAARTNFYQRSVSYVCRNANGIKCTEARFGFSLGGSTDTVLRIKGP